jgi:hypothetical protein
MQWVLGKRMSPPVPALATILLVAAVAVLSAIGDAGATPQLLMPGQLCPPIC